MSYDSPRMEAAMKALREDLNHPLHDAPRRAATLALNAADAVMFSDEAIERAAKAEHAEDWSGVDVPSWEAEDAHVKENYRNGVRIIIAALQEAARV